MSKVFTIVGVDPGTTVGISIMDFNGKLLETTSSKDMSINDIIEKILEYGMPSIVATDVSNIPQTVEKISVSLGAKIFYPSSPISIKEKNEIAKIFPSVSNAHERDSLSAAYKAYHYYRNKFENIDARLKEIGQKSLSEKVKALVVKGHSVSNAIELLTEVDRSEEKVPGRGEKEEYKGEERDLVIQKLQIRIINQRNYINDLSNEIADLKSKIETFSARLERYDSESVVKVKKSKEVMSKNKVIKKQQMQLLELKKRNAYLQRTINEIREVRALDLTDKVIVCKFMDHYNKAAIVELDSTFKLRPGDVVYIHDCSGGGTSTSQMLCDRQIKAVIFGKNMSHAARETLESCDIALISSEKINIKMHEDFAIVDKASFEEEYENWKRKHKANKDKEAQDWLDDMISKYRYERRKKTK